MWNRVKIVFSIFLLISSTVYSQKISSIEVEENKVFDKNQISAWSNAGVGEKVFPGLIDSVKSKLAFNLAQRGYKRILFRD